MLVHAEHRAEEEAPVADSSFGIARTNPARAFLLSFSRSDEFEQVLMVGIVANAVVMGIYDPLDPNLGDPLNENLRNQIVHGSQKGFAALYTVEAFVKLVAFGPGMTGNGYFANLWNWLDFFLVGVAWFQFIGGATGFGQQVSNLRVLRIMRLFELVEHHVPAVRIILSAVWQALPNLGVVSLLVLGADYIFAMIGVYLWRGSLQGNCGYYDPASTWAFGARLSAACSLETTPNHLSRNPHTRTHAHTRTHTHTHTHHHHHHHHHHHTTHTGL